jgi:NAD(P)-dependent dehydrogenase (short-subunit alcohol dehydrogenase family)
MSRGTAVIVGVGPGLGLELARIFGNAGHPVAMLARDKAKLDTFAKELASTGVDARGYVTDAADPVNLRDVLSAAIIEMGAPDVVVYNVGVLGPDSPTGGDDQKWALNTAVNILGARVAADAVLPKLRDGRGTLLFTGGGYALHPPRSSPRSPSARPGCAPTCKCFTTSWRGRGCTRPASRSRRRSAAPRATSRLRSPRHTSNWRIRPRPSGSTSWSTNPAALCCLLPTACLDGVPLGALGVGAAAGGGPLVPAGPGLGDVPAGRLLDPMAFAAPGPGVARAGASALVVRHRMLEV